MNKERCYLFWGELKMPIIFLILSFALSFTCMTKFSGFMMIICLLWISFELRICVKKFYYFFLFLSDELVYRKRLNLTEEEKAVFLYNPCPFLIKRYCQGKKNAIYKIYIKGH